MAAPTHTKRAGILEAGTVQMLVDADIGSRVLTEGHEHRGTVLSFEGVQHRIDFQELIGRSVRLYPQNEVFLDLAAAWEREGGRVALHVPQAHPGPRAHRLLHRLPVRLVRDPLRSAAHQRRRGEFNAITGSVYGRAYFADSYTGWADHRPGSAPG